MLCSSLLTVQCASNRASVCTATSTTSPIASTTSVDDSSSPTEYPWLTQYPWQNSPSPASSAHHAATPRPRQKCA